MVMNETFVAKYAVPDDQLPEFKLEDLRSKSPRSLVARNYATYTGFAGPTSTSAWTRIDFILAGSNGGWLVLR